MSLLASLFLKSRKWLLKTFERAGNIGLSGFLFRLSMYVCSRVISSGVIGMAGRELHPFVLVAVIVLVSGCKSLGLNPFSPTISMGLNPVWAMMSSFNDKSRCAAATSFCMVSCVGGCMPRGSMR